MGIDAGSLSIFGLVGLFVLNRLVFMGEDWHHKIGRFWALQALNLAVACALVVWGFPGLRENFRLVSALVAGVVVLHILMNGNRLQQAVLRERRARRAELEAENLRLRELVKQMEEDPGEPSG